MHDLVQMDGVAAIAAAERLSAAGNPGGAIAFYTQWLNANPTSSFRFAICFNLGVTLANVGQGTAAEVAYRRAIALNPECLPAQFNLGTQLEQLGRPAEAIAQWQSLLDQDMFQLPRDLSFYKLTLNNLGRIWEINKNYALAESLLVRSLSADPHQKPVIQHLVHLRQKQCEWPVLTDIGEVTAEAMLAATGPLSLLAASDSPEIQLQCAQRYVDEHVVKPAVALADQGDYGHERLRIGYLSGDLCSHPVAMLTVELFELHDREKFEIYAFCWSRIERTPFQNRVWKAFDHHIRVDGLNDEEAAKLIRSCEIDLLVDLHGLTLGSRANILAYRPAPVQITYLGFPGSSAIPGVDYVLADKYVLPEHEANNFTEKPIYLSCGFQTNDTKRENVSALPRAQYGLPENGVVFCCFNNNYKFSPEMFACWMRIVKRVPGSVLWLLAGNVWAQENFYQVAEAEGVTRDRLVFAGRVAPQDYLARYKAADLFLDTYPFGAGTTASDALWQSLPLITMPGRTFASRMGASLLNTMGLGELIAENLADYEEIAVALGIDTERLELLKLYLESRRIHSAVFDMERRVREIESAYQSVLRPNLVT